ncbi:MAG: hypothetical protein ACRDGS_17115, partial [Chloroflexota bacterium]
MRVAKTALGVALLGGLLFGGTSAVGAAPAGGAIQVYVTPNNTGGGPIVITGAIGDFGKTQAINKNGTSNPNGNFVKITLKKGTFEVDSTALNALNKMQPTVNPMTCSGSLSATEPVTLFNGTGLYKGISGTVKITENFAFVLPTFASGAKKGQGNESNSAQ